VDYCGLSSLLVRASAWDAAGGLDERFYPVYYVDVDLGLTLRHCGWTVLYEPRSRVRHHRGSSAGPQFRAFAGQRNYDLFIEKWRRALEDQEPFDPNSPEAIQRALDRPEALARRYTRRAEIPLNSSQFDPITQDQRHVEKDLAFQKAFAAHLLRKIEDLDRSR
jgi:GT2 family glycosyltransferase